MNNSAQLSLPPLQEVKPLRLLRETTNLLRTFSFSSKKNLMPTKPTGKRLSSEEINVLFFTLQHYRLFYIIKVCSFNKFLFFNLEQMIIPELLNENQFVFLLSEFHFSFRFTEESCRVCLVPVAADPGLKRKTEMRETSSSSF